MSLRGAGAFAEGMLKGYSIGRKIKSDREEDAFKDELKQAKEGVKTDRAQMVENTVMPQLAQQTGASLAAQQNIDQLAADNGTDALGVMTGAVPNLSPEEAATMPVDRGIAGYAVNGIAGKTFDSKDQATAAASERQPDFATMYAQRVRDKLVTRYTETGELDKAKQAAEWADGVKGKFYLGQSANVFDALASGDAGKLNDAYQKINTVYGNGRTDVSAAFDPQDKEKVLLTYTAEDGSTQQEAMGKDDVARQFLHQFNPEKGLELHLAESKTAQAAQTKMKEKLFDHSLKVTENRLNNEDKANREQSNIAFKSLLTAKETAGEKGKDIDKRVADGVKDAQTYIGAEYENDLKGKEKAIEQAKAMGTDTKELEADLAERRKNKDGVVRAAGEIISFTKRTENNVLKDMGPAEHKAMAEELITARSGRPSKVKIAYDGSSGKMVETFVDESRPAGDARRMVPITAPVDVDPSNKQHQPAIIGMDNKDPQTGKLFMPQAEFIAMRAKLYPSGINPYTGKPFDGAAAKVVKTSAKPAAAGIAAPKKTRQELGGKIDAGPSYQ